MTTPAFDLFSAPPPDPRPREGWGPRTVAIVAVGLRVVENDDFHGPAGACLVVSTGERMGETPIRCALSGRAALLDWLKAYESEYPTARDGAARTYVTDGPEWDRAFDVAELECCRAIVAWFAERKARR